MRSPASGVAAELGSVTVLGPLVTFVRAIRYFCSAVASSVSDQVRARADRRDSCLPALSRAMPATAIMAALSVQNSMRG